MEFIEQLQDFEYNPRAITVRDGRLFNTDRQKVLRIPAEADVISALKEHLVQAERARDLQGRLDGTAGL